MRANVWVRHGVGGWFVTVGSELVKFGKDGSTILYRTRRQARTAGIALAAYLRTELIVTNRNGKISERNSYGHDPETSVG
jgi:hypothetical protein